MTKSTLFSLVAAFSVTAGVSSLLAAPVVFEGKQGPGIGKKIVFVTGDDEYHSEEGMPLLARILSERHGFRATVLFAINPTTGAIDAGEKKNIPGLEALRDADAMVVFTRFRELEDSQMKEIVDYLDSGRPVIGLRTATHAFAYSKDSASPYAKYSWNNQGEAFLGGFGRQILGETWIAHHGRHGQQSTRGVVAPGAESHPILRGISGPEIYGPTDVYAVRLPLEGATPLVLGQVLVGMDSLDPAATAAPDAKTGNIVDKNDPMMPVAWTKTYTGADGKTGRVFTTTMGGAMAGKADWESEGFRRLIVNAVYWSVGLEGSIPEESDVHFVDGPNPFKRGVIPEEAMKALTTGQTVENK
ncbi:MAG: ThuA domain-containing protein [Verrucomicrobiota bacterium]